MMLTQYRSNAATDDGQYDRPKLETRRKVMTDATQFMNCVYTFVAIVAFTGIGLCLLAMIFHKDNQP